MYAAPHSIYIAMEVNFAFRRKVKMTTTCNFVSLGDKMRELLVKRMENKEERGKENKLLII